MARLGDRHGCGRWQMQGCGGELGRARAQQCALPRGDAHRGAVRHRGWPAGDVVRRRGPGGGVVGAGRDCHVRDRLRGLGAVRGAGDRGRGRLGGGGDRGRGAHQLALPADGRGTRSVAARRQAQARPTGTGGGRRLLGALQPRRRDVRPLDPHRVDLGPVRALDAGHCRRGRWRQVPGRPRRARPRRDLPGVFFVALLLNEIRDRRSCGVAALGAVIALALVPVAPAGVPVLAASLAALVGLTRSARAVARERL